MVHSSEHQLMAICCSEHNITDSLQHLMVRLPVVHCLYLNLSILSVRLSLSLCQVCSVYFCVCLSGLSLPTSNWTACHIQWSTKCPTQRGCDGNFIGVSIDSSGLTTVAVVYSAPSQQGTRSMYSSPPDCFQVVWWSVTCP